MDHEAAFVRAFMPKEKWARCLQLLPDRNRRSEVLVRLNKKWDYLPTLATEVPESEDFPEAVLDLLRNAGAPEKCYVMAALSSLDGKTLPLKDALREVFLQPFGALISCIPGELAYYRTQAPGHGVILKIR